MRHEQRARISAQVSPRGARGRRRCGARPEGTRTTETTRPKTTTRRRRRWAATVEPAARLEGVAKAGEIIITKDTMDYIDGNFKVKKMEPVQVKGKVKSIAPSHVSASVSNKRN